MTSPREEIANEVKRLNEEADDIEWETQKLRTEVRILDDLRKARERHTVAVLNHEMAKQHVETRRAEMDAANERRAP